MSNARKITGIAVAGLLALGFAGCTGEDKVTEQPTPTVTKTESPPTPEPLPEPEPSKAALGTRENPLLPGNPTSLVNPEVKEPVTFTLVSTEVRDGMTIAHFSATVDWPLFTERIPEIDAFNPIEMGWISLVLADGTIDDTYDGEQWDKIPEDMYPSGVMKPADTVAFSQVVDEHPDLTGAVWKLDLFTAGTYFFAADK